MRRNPSWISTVRTIRPHRISHADHRSSRRAGRRRNDKPAIGSWRHRPRFPLRSGRRPGPLSPRSACAAEALQAVVLAHQIDQFLRAARRCRSCGKQLARKDTKFLIYRTAFGKGRHPSPRRDGIRFVELTCATPRVSPRRSSRRSGAFEAQRLTTGSTFLSICARSGAPVPRFQTLSEDPQLLVTLSSRLRRSLSLALANADNRTCR